jgi:hypothetical protein
LERADHRLRYSLAAQVNDIIRAQPVGFSRVVDEIYDYIIFLPRLGKFDYFLEVGGNGGRRGLGMTGITRVPREPAGR